MRRLCYALRLAWDGAGFAGWQKAPGEPTVQGALEDALAKLELAAPVDGSSRTDRGVHARAAVASFNVRATLDLAVARERLQTLLPPAVQIRDLVLAPPSFHARWSASGKTYVYTVACGGDCALRLAFGSLRMSGAPYWRLPDPRAFGDLGAGGLDVARMTAALQPLVGARDLSAFASRGKRRKRAGGLTAVSVEETRHEDARCYRFTLTGPSFPRHGVRNIVAAAVAVGLGIAPPESLAAQLSSERAPTGPRAPGWGLCLWEVHYPPELDPFR